VQRQKIHKLREYQFADEHWEAQRLKTPVSQICVQVGDTPKIRFLILYQHVALYPQQNCRTAVSYFEAFMPKMYPLYRDPAAIDGARRAGNPTPSTAALDYDSTLIGALELSSKKWVFAVQLPGVKKHSRHVVEPNGPALAELIERLKSRSAGAGRPITRVIITHEAGRDGFWLARFLERRGVEVHVMQSSSLRWIGARGEPRLM
jgi:hypothetical protein